MGSNLMSLDGQVAVVVGGTSGIGRCIALALADAGATVVPTARRLEGVEVMHQELTARGCRSLSVTADVTQPATLERLADQVLSALGRVDILVNAAGCLRRVALLEQTDAVWTETMDTNATGTLRTCRAFAPHMIQRGYGRILNVASLNALCSFLEVSAYAASKAAVVALTRSMAVEWSARGICVNALVPGVFRTSLNEKLLDGTPRGQELLMRTPMKRFGRLDEVAGPALLLCSPSASFVTGQTLVVDGGFLASGVNQ